jgi:hypothetical protein
MNSANAALWSQFEGQSIENTYRLNRLIGVGGFAGVFEADHVVEGRTLRRVAVKLILADPESKQRQLGMSWWPLPCFSILMSCVAFMPAAPSWADRSSFTWSWKSPRAACNRALRRACSRFRKSP